MLLNETGAFPLQEFLVTTGGGNFTGTCGWLCLHGDVWFSLCDVPGGGYE